MIREHYGIPTMYKGRRFRSRLEATWAVFFDLIDWPWEYEPFDLEGYIPDFVIEFPKPVLIEVKPYGCEEEAADARTKIARSGWSGEAVVVGHRLMESEWGSGFMRLGWMIERVEGFCGNHHAVLFYCLSCHHISFCSEPGYWGCRRCGAHDGNAYISATDGLDPSWASAKNLVQWRPNDAA